MVQPRWRQISTNGYDKEAVPEQKLELLTPKQFTPNEVVIYQDFGLKSFIVERVLSEEDSEYINTEILNTAFLDWDFPGRPRSWYYARRRYRHHYSAVFHDLDGLIAREAKTIYPHVLEEVLERLSSHPHLFVLSEFSVMGENMRSRAKL